MSCFFSFSLFGVHTHKFCFRIHTLQISTCNYFIVIDGLVKCHSQFCHSHNATTFGCQLVILDLVSCRWSAKKAWSRCWTPLGPNAGGDRRIEINQKLVRLSEHSILLISISINLFGLKNWKMHINRFHSKHSSILNGMNKMVHLLLIALTGSRSLTSLSTTKPNVNIFIFIQYRKHHV